MKTKLLHRIYLPHQEAHPRFPEKKPNLEKLIYYQVYYSGRKGYEMTSKSGSKIENPIVLAFSIFYVVVGIAEIGYFAVANATAPPHIPLLGLLSLITAYSLFKMNKWTVPLAVAMFFTGMTFGAVSLSNSLALQSFGGAMLFNVALIVYMIILLIASWYIVAKRADFS
jgi:hypothetical protein